MHSFEFSSFSLASLNVRGLRDHTKRKALFLYCKRSNADFVFVQESHSCESDSNFWRSQWGKSIFMSHGSNRSAGTLILTHKFRGDILECYLSDEGRWIILVCKTENVVFILCNVYGYNSRNSNVSMFKDLGVKLISIQSRLINAYLIIAGVFNETPDDVPDRFPSRTTSNAHNNLILWLCENLSVVDAWRFFNSGCSGFTWSNKYGSLKARIDLSLISHSILKDVISVNLQFAPFTDHMLIHLDLKQYRKPSSTRGYWKFNCLLEDAPFNDYVTHLAKTMFSKIEGDPCFSWEFFKFKVRDFAVNRSKQIKRDKNNKEFELIHRLGLLKQKNNPSKEDEVEYRRFDVFTHFQIS